MESYKISKSWLTNRSEPHDAAWAWHAWAVCSPPGDEPATQQSYDLPA